MITLPSISEDEEEEEDTDNNNDDYVASKERTRILPAITSTRAPTANSTSDDYDDDDNKNGQFSPLLSQPSGTAHLLTADWLSSKGRIPNGHIGNSLRYAQLIKLSQYLL